MKVFNLLTACAIAAPLLFVSCSDDSGDNIDVPAVTDGPVTFSLGMGVVTQAPRVSRALSHETGFDYENEIQDAMVIIYSAPLNSNGGEIVYKQYFSSLTPGTNSETTITPHSYYSDGSGSKEWPSNFNYKTVNKYELDFGANIPDGTYYIIALANVGDLSLRITTLDGLRNFVYDEDLYQASDENHTNYSKFAMAALSEEKFTLNRSSLSNGTLTLPPLYVQRLAARIDLVFGKQGSTISHLADNNYDYVILANDVDYPYNNGNSVYFPVYDAEKKNRISGAVVVLDKLGIKNVVKSGQYLLERNNFNTCNNITILGNEAFGDSGYATYLVKSPDNGISYYDYSNISANSGFIGDANRTGEIDGNKYGVLGYVGENTFANHSDANKYTAVTFSGYTNLVKGHFDGATGATGNGGDFADVSGAIPVRHSTGTLDTSKPLAYGIVRNTIYRIKIRFYASGETIYARYYYYGTTFDGNDSKTNPNENAYNDIPFYNFILESDGTTPND